MIRRLRRMLARWHHRQHIKDLDFQIRVHEAHLLALPAEIHRVGQMRRFHQGRLATLSDARDPVNYRLGQRRAPTTHVVGGYQVELAELESFTPAEAAAVKALFRARAKGAL